MTNNRARPDTAPERAAARAVYRPLTDIYETDAHVVLMAELPGVDPDGVDVTLEERTLTIRGRLPALPREGFRQVYAEYGEGDFERVFTLSDGVDREGLSARFKHGVLTLEIPKSAQAKRTRIPVSTA